ncbi:uncharacterized protein LOC128174590 [Crassostrea angulata]|uniref:uncharacterized protein LOC128174590 n=1 Tax=Magallana angulata TaxID=2784310 RepID=UPI0022B15A83|nr:uncharacterized protein LOC128174590 [Crassostrea angulata]
MYCIVDVEKYITDGLLLMELKECKESLASSRIYMKTDFKMHLKQTDHCSDHCINHALSDPLDIHFQQACTDHQHDVGCDRCQLLPKAVLNLKEILSNLSDLSPNTREELFMDIDAAVTKILQWKSHIIRTINQDTARTHTLKDLQPGDILIIMDLAMKFLPITFREKQSDWYGQKGINWHVSVCIYKDENSNLKHRTFAHMLDGVRQDWLAVACLLEDTLHHVKLQLPSTTRAFIRSDNAGCYHCGNLWLAIPGISRRTGVFIDRYDYSEAQSGKSYCDAKIAHMRGKFSKVVASGYNILTAANMKSAIDLYEGTTGCQAAHVKLQGFPPSTAKCPIKGITKISNVKFEPKHLTTWRAFNIGTGKQLPIEHENNDLAELEIISDFVLKSGSVGHIQNPKESNDVVDSSDDHAFNCPEAGCTQIFTRYSEMQNHCLIGNHTYQLQARSSYDDIKMRWMDACCTLSEDTLKYSKTGEGVTEQVCVQSDMGWALKKERKSARFSDDLKSYLSDIFLQGENISDDDLDAVLLNIAKAETAAEFQ